MIQSRHIAAIAAVLQFISFFGLDTKFTAVTIALIGALMALNE